MPFVLPREHPNNILANVMAQLNWKNLRVAETEKYAHVTYFFNGGNEKPYAGEERELVASPKVATYDLKPEMSARRRYRSGGRRPSSKSDFDVIVMNSPTPIWWGIRERWSRRCARWKRWTPAWAGSTRR